MISGCALILFKQYQSVLYILRANAGLHIGHTKIIRNVSVNHLNLNALH